MNAPALFRSLERFPATLRASVANLSDEDATWRPAEGKWSVLEIVTHIADEEVEDFRTRVLYTLEREGEPWPPIDPEGWARERRYNDGDLAEVLARFESERAASLEWLRSLKDPDWSRRHTHPALGTLAAGDVLASWAAHDALHLRQIAERAYQLVDREAGTYSCEYAGPW